MGQLNLLHAEEDSVGRDVNKVVLSHLHTIIARTSFSSRRRLFVSEANDYAIKGDDLLIPGIVDFLKGHN